jgi:hypothetical protein
MLEISIVDTTIASPHHDGIKVYQALPKCGAENGEGDQLLQKM